MKILKNENGIDVVVEGGTDYINHTIAMVASRALADAGFTNTHRVFAPHGSSTPEELANTDRFVPSVLDVIRKQDPKIFATPVVIAAHDPKPFPVERRRFDRTLLQAEQIASAFDDSEDPDEIWESLRQDEKERILRTLR